MEAWVPCMCWSGPLGVLHRLLKYGAGEGAMLQERFTDFLLYYFKQCSVDWTGFWGSRSKTCTVSSVVSGDVAVSCPQLAESGWWQERALECLQHVSLHTHAHTRAHTHTHTNKANENRKFLFSSEIRAACSHLSGCVYGGGGDLTTKGKLKSSWAEQVFHLCGLGTDEGWGVVWSTAPRTLGS
jgi:hypothetical protein